MRQQAPHTDAYIGLENYELLSHFLGAEDERRSIRKKFNNIYNPIQAILLNRYNYYRFSDCFVLSLYIKSVSQNYSHLITKQKQSVVFCNKKLNCGKLQLRR